MHFIGVNFEGSLGTKIFLTRLVNRFYYYHKIENNQNQNNKQQQQPTQPTTYNS